VNKNSFVFCTGAVVCKMCYHILPQSLQKEFEDWAPLD